MILFFVCSTTIFLIWTLFRGWGGNNYKNFIGFLVHLKTTPKGHFEINWPLDFHHLCTDITAGVTGAPAPKFLGTLFQPGGVAEAAPIFQRSHQTFPQGYISVMNFTQKY